MAVIGYAKQSQVYIPLLNAVQDLAHEGIAANITFDISPVNCEQLADPAFRTLFEDYCRNKQKLAREDAAYFLKHRHEAHQIYLAQYWEQWYGQRLQRFYRASLLQYDYLNENIAR